MLGLTWDQVKGPVQTILSFLGGFVVSRGYLNADTMTAIVGLILTIVGGVWVAKSSTQASITSAAANLPNVNKVVTENTEEGRALAQSAPATNVVVNKPPV